ncbi:hypothetical protein V496_00913 [Pseudogymnoascus sp. VKM F-4515 (FW-2607)]|nr:hypothetical protein V496_00913 [Pseudogymnoascus sp. VKM F-4515 (FW-2607)]
MGARRRNVLAGLLLTLSSSAVSYVDYKEVPLYSDLAPCAMSAVSYALDRLTSSICPDGITALQSCACTKNNNAAAIATTISKSVSFECGSTATDDFASASQVFNQYCNPDAKVTAPATLPTPVTLSISDMADFSSLAPCAQSAVGYAVNSLTYDACPSGVAALQSCACTKGNIAADVQKSIFTSVGSRCGTTASEDFASASQMFSQYCNPGAKMSTKAANPNGLAVYITDLPAYSYLAPCAQSAVSYAVQGLTYTICPEGPSALNSCVCTKNQNSFVASSSLVEAVQSSCGSTHKADISSAQAVLAGYCKLGSGVTSFPAPSTPVGQMTYFITDMPIYSSLASCAQEAVHDALTTLTYSLCPAEAGPLASCACIKDSNSLQVSKILTDSVKYECSETATDDISSAMAVYNAYCSAARGLTTPTGITASAPTSNYGTVPAPATGGDIAPPTPTPTNGQPASPGSSDSADGSSGTDTNPDGTPKQKKSNTAAIAGGVVGGLGALLIGAGALFFFLRRRKQRPVSGPLLANASDDKPPGTAGTAGPTELAGKEEWKGAGTELVGSSPGQQHSELAGSGSPHGPGAEMYASPAPTHSELHGGVSPGGQGYPNSQSPGSPYGSTIHEAGAGKARPELHGSATGSIVSPISGGGQAGQAHEMYAYPMSATMNSPVYEMPAEYSRH